jgi:hypothetical protein
MGKTEKQAPVVTGLIMVVFCLLLFVEGLVASKFRKDLPDRTLVYPGSDTRVDRGDDPKYAKWATSGNPMIITSPESWSIESDTRDIYLYVYDQNSHLKARLVNPRKIEVLKGN